MHDTLLGGWLGLLRRRWRAGLVLFAVVAIGGSAFVLLSRPIYRAEAKLRLGEPPPMSGVSPTAGFFGLLRMGGDPFANDLEVLNSRTLAEHVVDAAALHVRLGAPRGWHRDSLFASLTAGRGTGRAVFTLRWTADGVAVDSGGRTLRSARAGEEIAFGDVRVVPLPWRSGMPRDVRLRTVPHAQAARELGGQFGIERARRDANVVRLRYQSTDPRVTHDVVREAVARFIALRTALMQRESGETVDSLRGVAERARVELANAEMLLETLQRTTGLVMPEAQLQTAVARYSEALGRLEVARMELRALEQALSRSAATEDAAESWAALLAYPRFLGNGAVGELTSSLTQLEQRRRELARRRTENNVELRAVTDQITHLDRSLRTLAGDFAGTLRGEVSALEQQVAAVRGELAAVPANAIEFGRRQRDVRVSSEMLVVTEQRLRQEELRQALTFANVQVIDPPALRDRPVWPRRKLGPAIALMIATATALVGIVVVDRADRRVRNERGVRTALGAPGLAVVRADRAPPVMEIDDAAALVRAVRRRDAGAVRFVVVDVPGGAVAAIVASALHDAAAANPDPCGRVCVEPLAAPASHGAAAAVAARGVPVLVAVEIGATTDLALARAAAMLREAGAELAAAVLVCRDARSAAEVWS